VRTRVVPVKASGEIERRCEPQLKRLGPEQSVLAFELEDGATIELAVALAERSKLPGPFLLAEGDSAQWSTLPRTDAGP
jgi:hypothetical protein